MVTLRKHLNRLPRHLAKSTEHRYALQFMNDVYINNGTVLLL
jgi:hypothetical protein